MAHDLVKTDDVEQRHLQKAPEHDLLQIDDIVQFVDFAWRYKFVITLGFVAGLLGGWLYCTNAPKAYESTAQLLVVENDPLTVDGMGPQLYYHSDIASSHAAIIKSPWLVDRAAREHSLHHLRSFAAAKDPVRAIIGALTITQEKDDDAPPGDTHILKFSRRANFPEDCPKVLEAIIEGYQQYLEESSQDVNQNALQLITEKIDEVQRELQAKMAEYDRFRQATPLVLNSADETSASRDRLLDIKSKALELRLRRADLETKLTALKLGLQGTSENEMREFTSYGAYRGSDHLTLQDRFLNLVLEEKRLLMRYGEDHPEVRTIHNQLEVTRELLAPSNRGPDSLLSMADRELGVKLQTPTERYKRFLEQELNSLAASEKALAKQHEAEREQARLLADCELKDSRFRKEIERSEELHATLINQLQGIDLSKDSGGCSTQVIAPPALGKQVAPRVLLVYTASAFLGLCLGFGLAAWGHFSDNSLRSPATVGQLGVPVLAQIPLLERARRSAENGDLDIGAKLYMVHEPESIDAEAFRSLRAALFVRSNRRDRNIIQVTSPNPGDGKSNLAANLAVSIAQSGKRVLLIDADLRRPSVHEFFEAAGDQGLSSVLRGELEPAEVIEASCVEGLSLLPSGPIPPSPADLLASGRFEELLELVGGQFDYVLVDTPPLLVATDAHTVAAQVDGVVMTLRLTKHGRADAHRAKELLHMAGAELIGVVINGVKKARHKDAYYGYWGGRYYDNGHHNGNGNGSRKSRQELLASTE